MHGPDQQAEEPTEKALGSLTFLRHNILFLLILITKSAVQTTPGEPFKHQIDNHTRISPGRAVLIVTLIVTLGYLVQVGFLQKQTIELTHYAQVSGTTKRIQ